MKISIITGYYFNSSDGIGRYAKNLIKELKKIDKTLVIDEVSQFKKTTHVQSTRRAIGFNLNHSVGSFVRRYVNHLETELQYIARFKNNNTSLVNALRNSKAEVFHAISPSESVAPIILNKRPLITTFHDVIPLISTSRFLLDKSQFRYYSFFAKKSDLILADSMSTKRDLIKFLVIPERKIKVVYPGIDISTFTPKVYKKTVIKTVLYLGGLVRRKGIYEALYAFSNLLKTRKDIRFLIGGTGQEELDLKREIERLNINKYVVFLGFIKENKMTETYHMADVFLYPSKYEGFGYTPLEAMACGIPVITSNRSSIPEVVQDAAICVDPDDVKGMSKRMNEVLSDLSLQKEMSKKGLLQAQKFSKENSAAELYKIYGKLV